MLTALCQFHPDYIPLISAKRLISLSTGYTITHYLKVDYELSVILTIIEWTMKMERRKDGGGQSTQKLENKNQRQGCIDKRKRKACEGKVRTRPDLKDRSSFRSCLKETGGSETAEALGNNALFSFFHSRPKVNMKTYNTYSQRHHKAPLLV